jgi:predicted site-specific integrase-resolvase
LAAKSWQVAKVVKEWGSGVNDQRPQFVALRADPTAILRKVGLAGSEPALSGAALGAARLFNLLQICCRTRPIVVEHQDRCARFGVAYIQTLLAIQGRERVIVNAAAAGQADWMQDCVAISTSLCARLYGPRRASRKNPQ